MDDLFNLIELKTTASVWLDFVPESETKPAIAITNLSGGGGGRDLEGNKAAGPSTWRLTVVANTIEDVNLLVKQLETLDNTTQKGFQNVFIDYVLLEPKQPVQSYRRAFVDVKLYK